MKLVICMYMIKGMEINYHSLQIDVDSVKYKQKLRIELVNRLKINMNKKMLRKENFDIFSTVIEGFMLCHSKSTQNENFLLL